MRRGVVDVITLGCSKNLVDSESLIRLIERKGYRCTHDSDNPRGEIVVINTCGFIEDAKQESIDTILSFAQAKDEGSISRLYVMGCLSQRYEKELKAEIPQVDKWYGKFNFRLLADDLGELAGNDNEYRLSPIATPRHYAYVKISEGCNRHCAYCAIPLMTGRHVSRPADEILDEIRQLVASGVKEFQIIAQELTYYGRDIDGKSHIAQLVRDMSDIKGVKWIRLHYAYPNQFPLELLDVIRERDNVCKYLDIALQHISDNVLTRMRRHVTKQETLELIAEIRRRVPGITLRTTLMVGFPGESIDDFNELMDFVREMRFERMGAFAYSEEDGTYSAKHYEDDVDKEEKERRLGLLMELQQSISAEIEAEKIGHVYPVVIDRKEGDYYVGRTEYCSPEVDPEVLVTSDRPLRKGCFYNVLITDSEEFDLYGVVVEKRDKHSKYE
ncbi:MAG: 30S ribosomal protein S12 methylthiotransferase RimO [Prevotella sp.]|nr:30S ribosomal protein S12 methylthiotransferase RimO [Prevotella sp.]